MQYFSYIIAAFCTLILTVVFIPVAMKLAGFIGAVDNPGDIKIHRAPIPRFGGFAVLCSFSIVGTVFLLNSGMSFDSVDILLSAGFLGIFLLGAVDDIIDVNAYLKFLFQIIFTGLTAIGLGALYAPAGFILLFVFIFILGYTNAFNFIDGVDGLASGIAFFNAFGLLVVALFEQQWIIAFTSAAILGATAGFLLFNFNPAKIFLGDSGSTLFGFIIAVLMMALWLNAEQKAVLLPLLIIAGLPVFDMLYVIAKRIKNGRSVFSGDRGHTYDIIIQKGYSVRQTVIFYYAMSLCLSTIGVILFNLLSV